jgi:REP element-mobilizing transposase RayT
MARPRRIEVVNGLYHVVSRGNNKQVIFDDAIRRVHLERMTVVAREFDWSVLAWALMSNHYHLVLRIGENGLSNGMHRLNLALARASNARFDRVNHCVGQRFWSKLIEKDAQLLASIRYTLWNPARAGIGDGPADSRWTSYRATAGLEHAPPLLAVTPLLTFFGPTPETARGAFERFVLDGRKRCLEPWGHGAGIVT